MKTTSLRRAGSRQAVPATTFRREHDARFEQLEQRQVFSPTPFPSLDLLEDRSNPVIRLNTTYGDIDIELFESASPSLVAEFLAGLNRGLTCDQTYFHRLLPGIALQGGLFGQFPDHPEVGAIPVCEPIEDPSPFSIGRANTERTIATGRLVDSGPLGTSPFVFNLTDNSMRFDPDQIVVFARVIDDRSWDVVQTIASLSVADLTSDTRFTGLFPGAWHNVPVTGPFNPGSEEEPGDQVTPGLIPQIRDLSIIRAPGTPDFYQFTVFEPEGFLNENIREFVPIENPNDVPVFYELTAHYENEAGGTLQRDDVIQSGIIAPHSRGGVRLITSAAGANIDLHDRPFALRLRSTAPLAATLSHYDFGATLSQPFTDATASTWYFPNARRFTGVSDFLVWFNPGNDDATVTVTFTSEAGIDQTPLVFTTQQLRRGGLNIAQIADMLDGEYSVRIDSTQPILVSRSHYAPHQGPGGAPSGYSELGAHDAPSRIGVLPFAADPGLVTPQPNTTTLAFFAINPGEAIAHVTIELYRPGATVPEFTFTDAVTIDGGRRGTFSNLLPTGASDVFTLVYRSDVPIHASFEVTRHEGGYGGAVPVVAGTDFHYADGFTDPSRTQSNQLEELVHLFNPNSAGFGRDAQDAAVTLTFRFADGFTMTLGRTVASGTMDRIDITAIPELMEQATMNHRYFYSIEISSDVPILAQMLHVDTSLGGSGGVVVPIGGGFITDGSFFSPRVRLEEPG